MVTVTTRAFLRYDVGRPMENMLDISVFVTPIRGQGGPVVSAN